MINLKYSEQALQKVIVDTIERGGVAYPVEGEMTTGVLPVIPPYTTYSIGDAIVFPREGLLVSLYFVYESPSGIEIAERLENMGGFVVKKIRHFSPTLLQELSYLPRDRSWCVLIQTSRDRNALDLLDILPSGVSVIGVGENIDIAELAIYAKAATVARHLSRAWFWKSTNRDLLIDELISFWRDEWRKVREEGEEAGNVVARALEVLSAMEEENWRMDMRSSELVPSIIESLIYASMILGLGAWGIHVPFATFETKYHRPYLAASLQGAYFPWASGLRDSLKVKLAALLITGYMPVEFYVEDVDIENLKAVYSTKGILPPMSYVETFSWKSAGFDYIFSKEFLKANWLPVSWDGEPVKAEARIEGSKLVLEFDSQDQMLLEKIDTVLLVPPEFITYYEALSYFGVEFAATHLKARG